MTPFAISLDGTVVLNKDAVKLVPELRSLSNDELLFVICVEDYVNSPYRARPYEDRKRLSLVRFFGKEDFAVPKKVLMAMDLYKGLIFDIKRETAEILKQRVIDLNLSLFKESDPLKIKKILDSVDMLESRINNIEISVMQSERVIDVKAGKRLSFIEQWQLNQKEKRKFEESIKNI